MASRRRAARRARAAAPAAHRADLRRNRRSWDRHSAGYDRRCARVLGHGGAMSWGLWRTPESGLGLLGEVRGLDVLEFGCGAARWGIALAARGARVTGIDLSSAQLRIARRLSGLRRPRVRLVHGNAERTPFRPASFDLVFCDWGAMTFGDPYRTVPECARLLRPGGSFVFAAASPFRYVTLDRQSDRQVRRLTRDYFGLHRLAFGPEAEYALPYGEWIQLFREHGFAIERLIESRPSNQASTPYLASADTRFGRRWPIEVIWKVRKVPAG